LMVVNCGGSEGRDLSIPARFRDTLTQQAKKLSLDTILAGLDMLSATRSRLRDSSHGRTLVEMALVRLGRLGELLSVAQLSQMLGQLGGGGPPPAATSPARPMTLPEGVKKNNLNPTPEVAQAATPLALTPETLPAIWAQVLRQVGALLASDLEKSGLPAIFGPNALALRFPSAYNQAREHCQDPLRIARVEEALHKVMGRAITVRVEAGSAATPTERLAPTPESPPAASRPKRNPREDAEKEPLIKRALDVLGAQIIRADEGFGTQDNEERERVTLAEDA
jgi:DNA polymerase-3 subunit gamma/tau